LSSHRKHASSRGAGPTPPFQALLAEHKWPRPKPQMEELHHALKRGPIRMGRQLFPTTMHKKGRGHFHPDKAPGKPDEGRTQWRIEAALCPYCQELPGPCVASW
jgi:hypothetical protein